MVRTFKLAFHHFKQTGGEVVDQERREYNVTEAGHVCIGTEALDYPFGKARLALSVPAVNVRTNNQNRGEFGACKDFAAEFAFAVYVDGMGFIGFLVAALTAIKYRVRRDVDHASTYGA